MGDPNNPGALGAAIVSAYNAGYRTITINPGTYTVPDISTPMCQASSWSNATISAYGVTIIETDAVHNSDIFDFETCTNVSLKGPTLSVTVEPCMQGHVTAIGPTASNGDETLDVSFDSGYPAPPTTGTDWFDGVDQNTGYFKTGSYDYGTSTVTPIGSGISQVDFGAKTVPMVVGDVIFGRTTAWPIKVRFHNCANCTFQDGTLYRNGFASCFDEGGAGSNHYLNLKWQPGPAPVAGGYVPVFCAAADGLHSEGAATGPDIENCSFQGLLQDDVIAVHGNYQQVVSASGTTFTVDSGYNNFGNGVTVRVVAPSYYQEGVISNYVTNANGTATFNLSTTYSGPNPSTTTVGVVNPGECGAGYKILNNTLGGTRSRIIIAKSDNGLIQGNTLSGSLFCAVLVGDESAGSSEAGYAHNVVIQNNTISNIQGVGIYVQSAANVIGNDNITIENNLFEIGVSNMISINGCNTALVQDNTFNGPGQISQDYLVTASISQNITLSANVVSNLGPKCAGLFNSTSTTGVTGATNGIYDTDTTYNINMLSDSMVMEDPAGGGVGTQLIQYPPNGGFNQQWKLTTVNSQPGYFTLTNLLNGLYASVSSSSAGSAVTLEDESGSNSAPASDQLWQFVPVDSQHVNIVNQSTGYCINVISGSTASGAQLCQWYSGSTYNQNWVPTSTLPVNWIDEDIGSPGLPGNASDNGSGTWTVQGGGVDIWNDSDQFNYAALPVTVDGVIIAKVTGITDTDPWAKAGVMFRNGTDAGSLFADMVVTAGEGVSFQWRNVANGACSDTQIGGVSAPTASDPVWVKLVKSGTTFTGYYSEDGTTWTQVGTTAVSFTNKPFLTGLAVTAHNNSDLNTATFTNVSFVGQALTPNSVLTQGQYIVSPDGEHILVQQSDGNLVVYNGTDPQHEGSPVWDSGYSTGTGGLFYTTLQTDGNLVTYQGTPASRGPAEWQTGTYGDTITSVQLTNAPEVQLLNGSTVVRQYP